MKSFGLRKLAASEWEQASLPNKIRSKFFIPAFKAQFGFGLARLNMPLGMWSLSLLFDFPTHISRHAQLRFVGHAENCFAHV